MCDKLTKTIRMETETMQMENFGVGQFPLWRLATVISIRKILLHLDEFYADIKSDIHIDESENIDGYDIVNQQIRNGWMYEIVSQTEQAIEDFFSLLMNSYDLSKFTKNVVHYSATKVKQYIREFNSNDLEYLLGQFHMPYFPLDEVWENVEIYEGYKNSVCIVQRYVKELQAYHERYYQDYCQYKHGLAVELTPFGKQAYRNDSRWKNYLEKHKLKGELRTFMTGKNLKKGKSGLPLVSAGMTVIPENAEMHIEQLANENRLIYTQIQFVDVDEAVRITEHAASLLYIVWENISKRSKWSNTDKYREVIFPTDNFSKRSLILFPYEPD